MAMTLLESAAIEQKKLRKGVLMAFYTDTLPSPVERISWENVEALNVPVAMLVQADSPTLRHINETPGAWEARFDQFQETLKIIENTLSIDPVLLMQKNLVVDPRQSKIMIYTRELNYLINNLLVNGDPTVDARNPAGLKFRLENDAKFVGQTVDAGVSAAFDIDADDAHRLGWLDFIDETLYHLDGGVATFCGVNRQTHLKFRSGLRALKLLDVTKDQFDREITTYRGVPFLDCGCTPAGSIVGGVANQVILNNGETSPIYARASTTSMYFVKGGEDHFMGLQMGGGLDVKHYGETPDHPEVDKTRFRWVVGFYTGHPRCIARLAGLSI